MERSSITRLVSKIVDSDGVSRSTNQTATNRPPAISPSDTLPSVNEFTNEVGDHTGQENPLHAAVHSLPDGMSADERARIKQLLDKMLKCVRDSQRDNHDHSNNSTSHVTPAPATQPPSNDAQGDTLLIHPGLPYWYGI